ncbi:tRNA lysidine(34) synthetase TilS [Leptospira idonii]|uniref:tRNA lysidine(34) synthetase TilS n=1 Tax=Leptospira idonii TaxID=1193500 RepID=UPI0014382A4E|nr:tRNA lysidine(34) synthetase TilS [Leptospira idonii]
MEETGRIVRYKHLNKLSYEHKSFFVTGHHNEDYLESVLLHLIRGGGNASLKTLSPLDQNRFLPLVFFTDTEKERADFLISELYPIFEDESNEDDRYKRNRIRKEILPVLKKENIDCHKLYWNFHSWDKDHFDFPNRFLETSSKQNRPNTVFSLSVSHQTWIQLTKQSQKQILDLLLKEMGFYPTDRSRFEEFLRQTEGEKAYLETNQYILYKMKLGDLQIYSQNSPLLRHPSSERENEKFLIHWNAKSKVYEDPNHQLRLGTASEGEKIKIKTGNKEISECLRERKIPFFLRQNVPILYNGNEPLQILFSLYSEEEKDYPSLDRNRFL